jgi:hypothetical protein
MERSSKLEGLSLDMSYQPCLIFVGKARRLSLRGGPERPSTQFGLSFSEKHYTMLERLEEKHSSLFGLFVSDKTKQIITLTPG